VTIPLKVRAAEIIREIGLPQDPWPGQDPELPAPSIRAGNNEQDQKEDAEEN